MQSKIIALLKISYIKNMSGCNFSVINVCKKRHLLPTLFITQQLLWLSCASVSSTYIFKSAHLSVTHADLHVLASFVCMGLFIHAPPPLIKPACTTARKRNASLGHHQWQDSKGACWLLCIFNPKISALLLWIHPLQLTQVTVCHSRSCDSAAHLVLPLNPFIVSHPSAPFSFFFLSSLLFHLL